jgi:hypothetical protein
MAWCAIALAWFPAAHVVPFGAVLSFGPFGKVGLLLPVPSLQGAAMEAGSARYFEAELRRPTIEWIWLECTCGYQKEGERTDLDDMAIGGARVLFVEKRSAADFVVEMWYSRKYTIEPFLYMTLAESSRVVGTSTYTQHYPA